MTMAPLRIVDLHVWYGHTLVAGGVGAQTRQGEIIALIGHESARERATLRATGDPVEGSIFGHLTCEENLLLPPDEDDIRTAGTSLGGGMSLSQIYELCPDLRQLRHTLGERLSAAEQRMLAIARILRTGANVIVLKDIADGLAPIMAHAFANLIVRLKRLDYTLIMAEQTTEFCGAIADRFYVLDDEAVVDTFAAGDLPAQHLIPPSFPTALPPGPDSCL